MDSPAKKEALRSVAGAGFAAALMTALGPFGTYDAMETPARALYWFSVIGLIWLQSDLVTRFLERALAGRLPRPNITLPALAALVVALPATAVVVVITDLMMPDAQINLLQMLWQVFLVLLVFSLAFNNLGGATIEAAAEGEALEAERRMEHERLRDEARAAAPRESLPADATFRRRFPPGLTGRLLCLEMEDHYLRIHTDKGSDIILMRMADAEQELAGVEGMRVHRSWWVAREAVTGMTRDGTRLLIHLENGLEIPVGKTYRAALKEAGWRDAAD
ncbi:MAG: LytTR family transcriptional regulator [Salinarimonas sp.]|nr:LytTR family transcriptional regulator [Salinarimonas sp.]